MSNQKDQFADLFSSVSSKKKDDSKLSLAERQRNSPMSSSQNKDHQWADFDLLERSRSSSRSTRPQNILPRLSQTGTPTHNVNTTDLFEGFDVINGNNNNYNTQSGRQSQYASQEDLFEGFTSPAPAVNVTHNNSPNQTQADLLDSFGEDYSSSNVSRSVTPNFPTSNQQNKAQGGQDLDDLFAVFDQPPKPQPSKLENPIPTYSGQQFDVLNNNRGSPQNPQQQHHNQRSSSSSTNQRSRIPSPKVNNESRDEAIASLIDMGFSVEQANEGLNHTKSGVNVEAAVSYIMEAAHQKARAKAGLPPERLHRASSSSSWNSQRNGSGSGLKQANKYFESFTNNVMKVSDKLANDVANRFFSPPPGSDGTPVWMREQEKYKSRASKYDEDPEEITEEEIQRINITDEASKLEKTAKNTSRSNGHRAPQPPPRRKSRTPSDAIPHRPQHKVADLPPKLEEGIPGPPEPTEQEEIDIFAPLPSSKPSSNVGPSSSQRVQSSSASEMMTSSSRRRQTPKAQVSTPTNKPQRPTITLSSIEKETFDEFRERGGVVFKQGDFVTALQYYEKSLNALPKNHVLSILAYSNCITTNFKIGDNKKVVEFANSALDIIGPTRGVSEEVEPGKDMKNFWIKISQRKAEALENLEKFEEALAVWSELIENGAANKVTLDGKRRCQDVLNPKPKAASKSKPSSTPRKPQPAAPSSMNENGEALKRVRESNKATQSFEEEKFKLHDQIEGRINNWKNGKEDNLRALLASFHEILWESSNWKQVSMADLVMPKKVKITYMKAVAKVHPDKVPQNASAEEKMIAQSVFIVLNTSWEKFKAANGIQ